MKYLDYIFHNVFLVFFPIFALFVQIFVKHPYFLNIPYTLFFILLLFNLIFLIRLKTLLRIKTNLKFILNPDYLVFIYDFSNFIQIVTFLVAKVICYLHLRSMRSEIIDNFRSISVIEFKNVLYKCFGFDCLISLLGFIFWYL